jgi:cell division protein FtsB
LDVINIPLDIKYLAAEILLLVITGIFGYAAWQIRNLNKNVGTLSSTVSTLSATATLKFKVLEDDFSAMRRQQEKASEQIQKLTGDVLVLRTKLDARVSRRPRSNPNSLT